MSENALEMRIVRTSKHSWRRMPPDPTSLTCVCNTCLYLAPYIWESQFAKLKVTFSVLNPNLYANSTGMDTSLYSWNTIVVIIINIRQIPKRKICTHFSLLLSLTQYFIRVCKGSRYRASQTQRNKQV